MEMGPGEGSIGSARDSGSGGMGGVDDGGVFYDGPLQVAVNPDLSKLKDTKPVPKVKVEALAKKVEAMVEQEQMEDEEMADEEPPVARQQKQTAKEAGKKAMSMADTLIAAVKKGGKGGKGKKAGQEERKAELKGMKRKTEQKPKGKKQRT
ncbi:hypothetical protein HYH02_011004 [Chlamydomonas schloesseri]|uniref:Uncharacterized protein n=1 Tax=Chlamydomonas schloesseri TaxID=2026947 RepID=A0A835T3J8_9CHLO|nr:hypothetical protein HYH02_011004 [Chlamydomonas schloesseri]|eukprot:KAG2438307.1 hypothetical protein HYH02_011004 [Chlamydomonas schloesseri]